MFQIRSKRPDDHLPPDPSKVSVQIEITGVLLLRMLPYIAAMLASSAGTSWWWQHQLNTAMPSILPPAIENVCANKKG